MYDSNTGVSYIRHAQVCYYDSNRLYLYISTTVCFIQPRYVACMQRLEVLSDVQSVFSSAMRLAAPSPKQSTTEQERGRALINLI